MERTPPTPTWRLSQRRNHRRWRVPTLVSHPPPPPAPMRTPVAGRRAQALDERPQGPPPLLRARTRLERLRDDCVFVPDMEVALQFLEARRRADEQDGVDDGPAVGILETPVAIGLLMTVAPPLAVTLVWSSRRFPRAAQIALTAYGALMTVVLAAAVIAAIS